MKKQLWIIALVAVALSGCYRMPDEDNLDTKPLTNNPAVTREPSARMIPGVNA